MITEVIASASIFQEKLLHELVREGTALEYGCPVAFCIPHMLHVYTDIKGKKSLSIHLPYII